MLAERTRLVQPRRFFSRWALLRRELLSREVEVVRILLLQRGGVKGLGPVVPVPSAAGDFPGGTRRTPR